MRATIIAILMAFAVLSAGAKNYWQDGLLFELNLHDSEFHSLPYKEYFALEGDTVVDGKKCLKFVVFTDRTEESYAQRKLVTVVYTEGDKVWCLPDLSMPDEWALLYDFGLAIGESAKVVHGLYIPYSDTDICYLYVKRVSEPLGGFQHRPINEMFFEEYSDEDCTERRSVSTGTWIDGIGNVDYPMWNTGYDILGINSSGFRVSLSGQVIWGDKNSVMSIQSEGRPDVVDGDELYDCSGRRVKDPCRGVYVNATTRRLVMVR